MLFTQDDKIAEYEAIYANEKSNEFTMVSEKSDTDEKNKSLLVKRPRKYLFETVPNHLRTPLNEIVKFMFGLKKKNSICLKK